MPEVIIRVAHPREYEHLAGLYHAWGYGGGIAPRDVVYAAQSDAGVIGLVRRVVEEGTTMLRGMYVHPAHRRIGVGTQLLSAFVAELTDSECFCVPLAHLEGFYGSVGFARVDAAD